MSERELNAPSPIRQESASDIVYTDTGTDYMLPDYLPDVRRILAVQSRAVPSGQYMGSGSAEFAGTCSHTVIYLDPKGNVSAATMQSDYDFSVPLTGIDTSSVRLCSMTSVENSACRLSGPRRMNVRAQLMSKVLMWYDADASESSDPGDAYETLKKTVPMQNITVCSGEPFSLSESIRTENKGEIRILASDGTVEIYAAEPAEGRIDIKGNLKLSALCSSESGMPFTLASDIPFSQSIECEQAERGSHVTVQGYPSAVTAESASDVSGEAVVTLSANVECEAVLSNNTAMTVVCDMFSTDCPCRTEYREISPEESVGAANLCPDLSAEVPRQEGDSENAYAALGCYMTVKQPQCTVENDKLVITAPAQVSAIVMSPGEEGAGTDTVSSISFQTSLTAETALPFGITPDTELSAWLIPQSSHCKLSPQSVSVWCGASVMLRGTKSRKVNVVSGFTADREAATKTERSQIVAAYLTEDDTLWTVAKRYGVPCRDIIETNGMPDIEPGMEDTMSSTEGIVRLLIEK